MSDQPANEHEVRETLTVDIYYPDHEDRSESHVFYETKKSGHEQNLRCAVSGQPNPEYHHVFIEWADANAVDWRFVRDVAVGTIKSLESIDPETGQPTGDHFPVEHSMLWFMITITSARGFDWHAFDPEHPEQFVDSMANMLPLHETFHRRKDAGIHMLPGPIWNVFWWPKVGGFVSTTTEEKAIQTARLHAAGKPEGDQ